MRESFYNELRDFFNLHRDWSKNKNENIFPITSQTISDEFKHYRDKYQLNENLKPAEIRRLCFTRLEGVFSLKDQALFLMWTQHKPKDFTLQKHYIKGKLEKAIEYLPKIQDTVLIDNVESYIREIASYKNGMNRVRELEEIISVLLDVVKPKKTRESLERELEEIETTEEGKQRAINMLKSNLSNGFELHENDLEVYIEDLKEDIEKHKKLELLESKFKNI